MVILGPGTEAGAHSRVTRRPVSRRNCDRHCPEAPDSHGDFAPWPLGRESSYPGLRPRPDSAWPSELPADHHSGSRPWRPRTRPWVASAAGTHNRQSDNKLASVCMMTGRHPARLPVRRAWAPACGLVTIRRPLNPFQEAAGRYAIQNLFQAVGRN